MSESISYVTYYVAPQQKTGVRRSEGENNHSSRLLFSLSGYTDEHLKSSELGPLQDFIKERKNQVQLLSACTEISENRRTAKWPELQKALEICRQKNATLLIIELGNLASNESFTQTLLTSGIPFYCLDQPFVNQTILEALSKHAEVQRKLHGKLIREGLKMTTAKSGNPNAAEVISKVNKPKIDTAIVFALLLEPIIQDYRKKGYSQRQMVKMLNEEGFTAPEGGKWVLSQLQKVLDRVRLNEIAASIKPFVEECQTKALSLSEMAEAFNVKSLPSLKIPGWDDLQVKKLLDRIQQIKDITLINGFVLNLLPVLHEYQRRDFSPIDILKELNKAQIPIYSEEALTL